MTHWYRKLATLAVVSMLMALGAGVAAAQENPPRRPQGVLVGRVALLKTLSEMSGQSIPDIVAQVEEGETLNDLAAALGLDPAAVVDHTAANLAERINQAVANGHLAQEQADEVLATLGADLTDLMARPVPERPLADRLDPERIRQLGGQGLIGALTNRTGLSPADLLAQARDNDLTTLAEIAAFNDIPVEDVIAAAEATAAERINAAVAGGTLTQEQADALLARASEYFANAVDHELPIGSGPVADVTREIVSSVVEQTGLEPVALLRELRGGATMQALLEANGSSVDVAVSAIMNGVEARTNRMLAGIEERVRQALTGEWQPGARLSEGRRGLLQDLRPQTR